MCPSPNNVCSFRLCSFHSLLVCLGIVVGSILAHESCGQDREEKEQARQGNFDPRRWLEQLDANQNGKLDPQELTGRAREFAAPKLKELGFNPDQPISIKSITRAVEKNRAAKNAGPPAVPGFGMTPEMTLVPGFDVELGSALAGIGTLEERYAPRVLARLQQTLDRYDKNKDGILDQKEIAEAKWIYGDPTQNDLNKDGILTKTELAERYLARGQYEKAEQKKSDRELGKLYRKPEEWKKRWEKADKNEKRRMGEFWKREYDKLDDEESRQKTRSLFGLGGKPEAKKDNADPPTNTRSSGDKDQSSYRKVYRHVSIRDKMLAEGVPDDFIAKDKNGDGQVQMNEYETKWTAAKLTQFNALDANGDGVLSAEEWGGN